MRNKVLKPFLPVIALLFLILPGCAFINVDLGSLSGPRYLQERLLEEGGDDKILVLEILGTISQTAKRTPFSNELGMMERVDLMLRQAKKDEDIKGIILRIDSPGGGVSPSDLIYQRIMEFKKEQNVPVVACITGTGASGAYMAALSADKIVALPLSVVGNVGVLIPSISLAGLMDTLGIENQTLKSGKYKDVGNPMRDMNDDEKKILMDVISEFYNDFIEKVKANRPVTKDDLIIISDGRIMTASKALEHHLIDKIGYYDTALETVSKLAKVENPTVVVYRRSGENVGGFYSWP